VALLILDHASLYFASSLNPRLEDALDNAYSQYISSKTHDAVQKQFSASPEEYSILQFTEFILEHRL
jgi:hypothetical protein